MHDPRSDANIGDVDADRPGSESAGLWWRVGHNLPGEGRPAFVARGAG